MEKKAPQIQYLNKLNEPCFINQPPNKKYPYLPVMIFSQYLPTSAWSIKENFRCVLKNSRILDKKDHKPVGGLEVAILLHPKKVNKK